MKFSKRKASQPFVKSQPLFERAAALLKRLDDKKVSAEVMRNYAALLTVWGSDLMRTNQTAEARKAFSAKRDHDGSTGGVGFDADIG